MSFTLRSKYKSVEVYSLFNFKVYELSTLLVSCKKVFLAAKAFKLFPNAMEILKPNIIPFSLYITSKIASSIKGNILEAKKKKVR